MRIMTWIVAALLLAATHALAAQATSGQPAQSDPCAPNFAVYVSNNAHLYPREIASDCTPAEVMQAASALGMARMDPPTIKAVITAQWIVDGTFVPPGSSGPRKVSQMVVAVSYVVPAIRLQFDKEVLVAAGRYAWNETSPGVGATVAPAGALEQRLPLIWLTPHGAIWAAIEAGPSHVKITKTDARTTIVSTLDGMQVTASLDGERRPETVEVRTSQGVTYRARYSGYHDPDDYGVITPRTMEWTIDGRQLATLSVPGCQTTPESGPGDPPCGFRGNPYVVFPVPATIKDASPR